MILILLMSTWLEISVSFIDLRSSLVMFLTCFGFALGSADHVGQNSVLLQYCLDRIFYPCDAVAAPVALLAAPSILVCGSGMAIAVLFVEPTLVASSDSPHLCPS